MNIARSPLLAILLLTACGSAPTRVFTIEPVQPRTVIAYTGPAVRVNAVHVPPAFDRTEILTNVGNGELRIDDIEHWSAPLGQLARQALTLDLMERLPAGRVIFPHLSRPPDTVDISVDMLALDTAAPSPQLTVSWALAPGQSAGTIAAHTGTAILHGKVSRTGSTAETMSDLIAQLADRIAADLGASIR